MSTPETKISESLRKRHWAEERQSKPRSTRDYVPLDEREDQSWKDKVETLDPGQ